MARIPRDVIDAIRDRTDIVEAVGRHVRLQRKGGSYVGLCPFHQEKTPSFNVVPTKGIYHCFGCNAGGDVFRFMMELEGVSFIEAVKELAGPAGITIPERELSHDELENIRRRATLSDVLDETCKFFEACLWTRPEGQPARDYLDRRQMGRDIATRARLGWAPAGWTRLVDHLHGLGFSQQLAVEAGVARQKESRIYDAFRERVIIPILDERGRVIAFGGRLLEGEGPKYINSPETERYKKSRVLYGIEVGRRGIGKADRCIVVEGYFDVLSMQQVGFDETVATCGTALTRDHLERIRRLTRNVIMLTDSDEAGSRAAERSLPLFLEVGLHPWRVQLPGAKDPDDLIREGGAEAITKAIELKEPLLEWMVQRRLRAVGHSATGSENVIADLLPLLKYCPPDLISRIAARARVNERTLLERVRKHVSPPSRAVAHDERDDGPSEPMAPPWRPTQEVVHLLWLLVHRYDEVADLVADAGASIMPANSPARTVLERLTTGEPIAAILQEIEEPMVKKTLYAVSARSALYEPEHARAGVCQILDRIVRPRREAELARIREELDRAIRSEDFDRVAELTGTRQKLVRLKKDIERSLLRSDVDAYRDLIARELSLYPQESAV